jgi:hypothetical protein
MHLSEILETRDKKKREWVMRISQKDQTTLGSKLLEEPFFVLGSEGMGEKRREELLVVVVAAAKSVSDHQ